MRRVESISSFTNSLPFRRNGTQGVVAEAGPLRPDPGVNDADNHTVSVAALVPQGCASGYQSQKRRAVCGRQGVHFIRVQFQNPGEFLHVGRLSKREPGRESVEDFVEDVVDAVHAVIFFRVGEKHLGSPHDLVVPSALGHDVCMRHILRHMDDICLAADGRSSHRH